MGNGNEIELILGVSIAALALWLNLNIWREKWGTGYSIIGGILLAIGVLSLALVLM